MRSRNISFLLFILTFLCNEQFAFSQLTVSAGATAASLAASLAGPGVSISGASLSCNGIANGTFTVTPGTPLGSGSTVWGIGTGIMLSTGSIGSGTGPEVILASTNLGMPGDPALAALAGATTRHQALLNNLKLTPSTKFHIVYRNEVFPPKAIVRLAAQKMGIKNLKQFRLNGGESTNKHLKDKGFKIVQFADWKTGKTANASDEIEWKITRLTFNTNGWVAPSGIERKSTVAGLHEADYGFGHEEWLFDFSKKIRNYKYGFIEGFRTKHNKHGGSTFNLQLFTIDSIEKEKYWIGTIKNCNVLTKDEQIAIGNQFLRNGWISEKEKQLKDLGLWQSHTKKSLQTFVPNVRFIEEDVNVFDTPIPVEHNLFIDSRDRYLLYDWDKSVEIVEDADLTFHFNPSGPNQDKKVQRVINSNFQSKEIKQLHRKIASALYDTLLKETSKDNIACDQPNSDGTYIDMVRKVGQQYVLYEIKTYTQLRKNIREAIGQLLEYAYWTKNKKIKEIVIVSEKAIDPKANEYLNYLKSQFQIPISYLHQKI